MPKGQGMWVVVFLTKHYTCESYRQVFGLKWKSWCSCPLLTELRKHWCLTKIIRSDYNSVHCYLDIDTKFLFSEPERITRPWSRSLATGWRDQSSPEFWKNQSSSPEFLGEPIIVTWFSGKTNHLLLWCSASKWGVRINYAAILPPFTHRFNEKKNKPATKHREKLLISNRFNRW